jgi:acyl carrier protein
MDILPYILTEAQDLVRDWEDPPVILQSSWIFENLGFDSLDLLVLCMAIQDRLGIQIPFSNFFDMDSDAPRDRTILDLAKFVEEYDFPRNP